MATMDADFMPYVFHQNKAYTSQSKVFCKKRMKEMAEPKSDLMFKWLMDPRSRNRIQWGTQDELTPSSNSARCYAVTRRIVSLSQPKRHTFVYGYKDGSVHNESPRSDFNRPSARRHLASGTLTAVCSAHTDFLARPVTNRRQLSDSVSTQSEHVKKVVDSPGERIEQLARHKLPPTTYRPARQLPTETSNVAMKAVLSSHVDSLSGHKRFVPGPFREPEWQVSESVKRVETSSRVNELSKHKCVPEEYQIAQSPCRAVSIASRKAVSSARINELSVPVARESMDRLRYNPMAFVVSTAAKQARANPRILELAQPINR